MGEFKKYRAGLSIEEMQTNTNWNRYTMVSVTPCHTLSGDSVNRWYIDQTMNMMKAFVPYAGLVPVATADENYDSDDYQISAIGTTAYSTARTASGNKSFLTFTITVTNSTASDITVKCIKFKKTAYPTDVAKDFLVCGYFLDQSEWKTISAGASDVIVVVMQIG